MSVEDDQEGGSKSLGPENMYTPVGTPPSRGITAGYGEEDSAADIMSDSEPSKKARRWSFQDFKTLLGGGGKKKRKQPIETGENTPVAVLFVGTTGTGKSSVIGLLTSLNGSEISSRAGANSVTRRCAFHHVKKETAFWEKSEIKHILVDTPGLQDSWGRTDHSTFGDILKRMSNRKIANLKVVWCVNSGNERMAANIKAQAKFIAQLCPDNSKLWKSVIIVEKKPAGLPKLESGVSAAAQKYGCNEFNESNIDNTHPQYLGCTCIPWIDDTTQRAYQEKLREINPAIMYPEDFRKEVAMKIDAIPHTQVLYFTLRCTKCGQVYDKRYPPTRCHAPPYINHSEGVGFQHQTYRKHASNEVGDCSTKGKALGTASGGIGAAFLGAVLVLHPVFWVGGVAVGGAAGFLIGGAVGKEQRYHKCCEQKCGSEGCTLFYKCCHQKTGDRVPVTEKCPQVCRLCNQCWTAAPPCQICGPNLQHTPVDVKAERKKTTTRR